MYTAGHKWFGSSFFISRLSLFLSFCFPFPRWRQLFCFIFSLIKSYSLFSFSRTIPVGSCKVNTFLTHQCCMEAQKQLWEMQIWDWISKQARSSLNMMKRRIKLITHLNVPSGDTTIDEFLSLLSLILPSFLAQGFHQLQRMLWALKRAEGVCNGDE